MNFKKHYKLEGLHAFLGASKYHWINYNEEKLASVFLKQLAVERGTELHKLASECIRLGVKLPKTRHSLNTYVNDAIGYRMVPEQPLFYSQNAFGTADAICFKKNQLRIHDLKTGATLASMKQLEIYAALFFLEYEIQPKNVVTELRIYQSEEIIASFPTADDIIFIMEKIITFDRQIEKLKMEE